ncbi:MAG: ATP-binding protein [Planctomycetota bacterium]
MAQLFVVQGEQLGHRFELGGSKAVIGRETGCDIRIKDPEISRRHLEIRRESGQFKLIDLGSANGTLVNGIAVRETWLRRGDRIQIGQTQIMFQDEAIIRSSDAGLERVRIVPANTGEDKSAIVQTLPAMADIAKLFAGSTPPHWLQERLASLDVIYQASREISLVTNPDELLPRILELVFDAIGADRGSVLLMDTKGAVQPRAVRCRGVAQKSERLHISHSIVEHVLHQRQGVICADTLADSRFSDAPSVVQHGIREAICVPLQGRHSILGVIYADHRSPQELGDEATSPPPRKFSQDHLALMVAIGHQAGLALENSSLYQAKLDSERLAAIGQTITIVSHHIKNVLQGLKGGSSLIQTGLDSGDMNLTRRGQSILERNLGRVYDLVLDMLSYAKSREPLREEVKLADLISDLVELMKPRAESYGLRLESSPVLPELICWVDEEGLHRAILNLITNAIDAQAGHEGGLISIDTNYDESSDTLRIKVSDNGPGIAEGDLANLFELFASSKGSKGTGLGLPVSDKIIREHGGQILVESKFGMGACFTIEIPHIKPPIAASSGNKLMMEATLTGSSIHRANKVHDPRGTLGNNPKMAPDVREL